MHTSLARKSLLIRMQILVADHGSQIAARFLKAGKSWEKFQKFNFINHWSRITESYAYQPCQKVSLNQNKNISCGSRITDHRSQQEFLRLANFEKKFKDFYLKSLITDHGSQNYMQIISLARIESLLIRIQILVADHGSQIAARILEAGKFWEKK